MKENCEIIYNGIDANENYEETIKKVVNECFQIEKLEKTNLYMSITLTIPEEIRKINMKYRNIDRATDVLSFPMFEKEELEQIINQNSEKNVDKTIEKIDILGDIVISIPKVYEQADEYGHSFERELSYMVVHGFYHLMGYDHMQEDEKKVMRQKEEIVLSELGISRESEEEAKKNETSKNEKKLGNSNFIDAWRNAINGIIYATTTQSNVKKQLLIAVFVVIISLFFELSKAEFLIFMFTIVLILFAEMVNTAIETVVDLYVDVYHPKAKIAKDVAAGGVVITTINAIIVAYFLFFDKIADIGLTFLKNVTTNPMHLAFSIMIIAIIAVLALIAYAKTNKHKGLNKKMVPSGHATIGFAANTLIWLLTDNIVILMLSLLTAILLAESRIAAKEHTLSEIIFSGCFATILVLILYGIAMAIV